jgi:hypothetical protein
MLGDQETRFFMRIPEAVFPLAAFAFAALAHSSTTLAADGIATDADRAAILAVMNMPADTNGMVMNECGEAVTPGFLPAEMGGAVGTAILFVMEGGPNSVSCYGDRPDLHLMMRDGDSFREIYAARGRVLVILSAMTDGVRDIADGGPGFS